MLRLDSSEMLPGSQKGEETAQIPSTAIVEGRRRIFRLYHFALILQNNPQYQLRRSVSYGFDRRTTIQPVFFAKSHV